MTPRSDPGRRNPLETFRARPSTPTHTGLREEPRLRPALMSGGTQEEEEATTAKQRQQRRGTGDASRNMSEHAGGIGASAWADLKGPAIVEDSVAIAGGLRPKLGWLGPREGLGRPRGGRPMLGPSDQSQGGLDPCPYYRTPLARVACARPRLWGSSGRPAKPRTSSTKMGAVPTNPGLAFKPAGGIGEFAAANLAQFATNVCGFGRIRHAPMRQIGCMRSRARLETCSVRYNAASRLACVDIARGGQNRTTQSIGTRIVSVEPQIGRIRPGGSYQ